MHTIVLQWFLLVILSQVEAQGNGEQESTLAAAELNEKRGSAQVIVATLEVFDRPDEASYITGALRRGDGVNVRGELDGGWLAIEPPAATICWIEGSAIDLDDALPGQSGHMANSASSNRGHATQATVVSPQAIIRSGQPEARLPGPPWGQVSKGTMVRLLDRSPLEVGTGRSKAIWYAIVPPPELLCYLRVEGTRRLAASPPRNADSETISLTARYAAAGEVNPPSENLPSAVAAEIKTVDEMHRLIRINQPIAQWRFETVRSSYQAILKRAGIDPNVEEAVRVRLAQVARGEQAAQAARTIENILVESHRRDHEVAALERRVAAASRAHAAAYSTRGFVQASSEMIDGRKLYVLIASDGSTIAYLDVPPGLDIDPLLAHRIGVRGDPHFNEELGARLITVRDVEKLEPRR
jgi:hypothetical protein